MSDQSLIPNPAYAATMVLPADAPQVVALHWEDAMAGWKERMDNRQTRRNYLHSVKHFFIDFMPEYGQQRPMPQVLCDVSLRDVATWRAMMVARTHLRSDEKHHLASATLNRHIAAVRSFFSYWRDEPEEHGSPNYTYVVFGSEAQAKSLKNLKGKTEQPYAIIHEKHFDAVLDIAAAPQPITAGQERLGRKVWEPKYTNDVLLAERDVAIMTMALGTGLRVAELAELEIRDIFQREDHKGMLVWWVHVREGKGHKSRDLPLSEDVVTTTLAYIAATNRSVSRQSDKESPLWRSRQHDKLSVDHVRAIIDSVLDRATASGHLPAGLKLSPHSLRHTYAAMLLTNGATIAEIQQLLGHSSIITTQRYIQHVNDAHLATLAPRIRQAVLDRVIE